jgi:hypothetical protein
MSIFGDEPPGTPWNQLSKETRQMRKARHDRRAAAIQAEIDRALRTGCKCTRCQELIRLHGQAVNSEQGTVNGQKL